MLEIDKALKSGNLGNINLRNDKDLVTALNELKFLKDQGHANKAYTSARGGGKNTVKAWVHETTKDSDISQGYTVASNTWKVTKAGVKLGRTTAATAARGALMVGGAVPQAKLLGDTLKAKYHVRNAKSAADMQRYKVALNQAKQASYELRTANKTARAKVRTWGKNGTAKTVSNRIARTKPGRAVNAFMGKINAPFNYIKNKLAGTAMFKALGKLNIFMGKLKFWVALIVIALLLISIIFFMIVVAGSQIKVGTADYDYEKGMDVETSPAQIMIDYLFSFQEAYAWNATRCSVDNIGADGSLMIEKRMPDTWFDQIRASDPYIDTNEAQTQRQVPVCYNGTLTGYDFRQYWGQAADNDGEPPGLDTFGNDNWFKTVVSAATGVTETKTYTGTNPDTGDPYTYTVEEMIYEDVPIYIYGNAGQCGDAGIYSGSYKTDREDGMFKFNIKKTSDAYKDWLDKENEDVYFKYHYNGSVYSYKIPANELQRFMSFYYDTENRMHYYDIEEFYKSLLTLSTHFVDNSFSTEYTDMYPNIVLQSDEDSKLIKAYAKRLFDQIMEDAILVLQTEFVEDPEQMLTFVFHDKITGEDSDCEAVGHKCIVNLDIYIPYCGVCDMMMEDSKQLYGDEGNLWAHFPDFEGESFRPTSVYNELDESSTYYQQWLTTQVLDAEGMVDENQLPHGWGQNRYEGPEDVAVHSYPDGQEHRYTQKAVDVIDHDNLTVADWEEIIEGIHFPTEIDIAVFDESSLDAEMRKFSGALEDLIEMMEDEDWDPSTIDWDTFTTGDNSLDDFLRFALSQGMLTDKTGIPNLCCFTSYVMIAMQLCPDQAQYIYTHLPQLVQQYTNERGYFDTSAFLTRFGITQTSGGAGNEKTFTDPNHGYTDMKKCIKDNIDTDKPVMLHLAGSWTDTDGRTNHTSQGHFVVIYGYTDNGVKICDPAHGNYTISYVELWKQIGYNAGPGQGIRTFG